MYATATQHWYDNCKRQFFCAFVAHTLRLIPMSTNTLKSTDNVACLLIVYKRFDLALEIVDRLFQYGVQDIYIALDVVPKNENSSNYQLNVQSFLNSLKQLRQVESQSIFLWKRDINFGCALSVITACDWFFQFEEHGIVLEDDCLPTLDFLNFVKRHEKVINGDPRIMMICGTQHAVIQNSAACDWILSHYPFMWGWYTNRNKWLTLRSYFAYPIKKLSLRSTTKAERLYWRSGSRRAIQRLVDVWDTPMVANMINNEQLVILPTNNLIINTGDDVYATNFSKSTRGDFAWNLNLEHTLPISNVCVVDESIRKNFFRIRSSLIIRNVVRHILDSFKTKKTTLDQALILPNFQVPLSRKFL